MVITSATGEKIIYPNEKILPISALPKYKAAAVTFAKMGGITILSSLVPIAHFVLVPVFAVVTLAKTYSAVRKKYELVNFEVHCPNCDAKTPTSVAGADLPLRTFCMNCRNMVYLSN